MGTLAGISLTFISMRPAFQSWEVPWIAFITLGIVMVRWMANVRPPGNVPGGPVAVVIGTAIAWIAAPLGLSGYMQPTAVGQAFTRFGLRLPLPTADVFVGLADTGICVGLVCFLGLVALLLAVIPLVAVLPILLYIGVVITAQAFEATPSPHAPAVVLALIPNLASWGQLLVDSALNAAGTSAAAIGAAKLADAGLVYHGMELLGGGAILAAMVLAAIAAFIIDHDFKSATLYALAGAVLSFFGFIHGAKLGFGESWQVALGYLLLGGICWGLARREPAEEPASLAARRMKRSCRRSAVGHGPG